MIEKLLGCLMRVTNAIFESYHYCKYKAWLQLHAHFGNKTEFELLDNDLRKKQKDICFEHYLSEFTNHESVIKKQFNQRYFNEGEKIILTPFIKDDNYYFNIFALEKIINVSNKDSLYYTPILLNHNEKILKVNLEKLAIISILMGRIQNKVPEYGKIIYGSNNKIKKVRIETHLKQAQKFDNEIIDLKEHDYLDHFRLTKHCSICEFYDNCYKKAVAEDNISLLSGLSKKELERQNAKGIFTVNQYSYTFRPRKRRKRPKNNKLQHFGALKALAIRENKIYVFEPPILPSQKTFIYLDIEGVPQDKYDYLIGVVIVNHDLINQHSFWAQNKDEEEAIILKLLDILSSYTDFRIFHYGNYELSFLKRWIKKFDGRRKTQLERLIRKTTNILSFTYYNIYFPTYSNSLKDIGNYLNYCWSTANASGIKSIIWRKQWEQNKEQLLKEILIQYNIDDCLALKTVTEFIYKLVSKEKHEVGSQYTIDEISNIQNTNNYNFHKQIFANAELDHINKCSYFDYQREKIFLRNNPKLKKILLNKKRKVLKKHRINSIITLRSRKCPRCKGNDLKVEEYFRNKIVYDLKFTSSGVKRWVEKYTTFQYRCRKCNKYFLPTRYKKIKKKLGGNLINWCLYQYAANRQPYQKIIESLSDIFSLSVSLTNLYDSKIEVTNFHKRTFLNLQKKIVTGQFLHADETEIKLQKTRGYVWVFTNMEEVIYIYKESREGDFLHKFLKDFNGILISDFYSAYDSVDCQQQKCLVHLIRDMNDSFYKNPFDEEFKIMVGDFSALLREIIDTIDRFGLKKRFLNKHKKKVDLFFNRVIQKDYTSEIALQYQKRFKKNYPSLFTFLNYDSIPWNNNNAEHAIKSFAKHRMLFQGRVTESGIKSYLILLSIYQTCRRKGLNFLEFLLSGKRDIDNWGK